jgi:hypothetical protein
MAPRSAAPAAASEPAGAASRSFHSRSPSAPDAQPPRPRSSLCSLLLAALCAAAAVVLFAAKRTGAAYTQSLMADFWPGAEVEVSEQTRKVHDSLFVFDLHCDASFVPRREPPGPPPPALLTSRSRARAHGLQGHIAASEAGCVRPLGVRAESCGRSSAGGRKRRSAGVHCLHLRALRARLQRSPPAL